MPSPHIPCNRSKCVDFNFAYNFTNSVYFKIKMNEAMAKLVILDPHFPNLNLFDNECFWIKIISS